MWGGNKFIKYNQNDKIKRRFFTHKKVKYFIKMDINFYNTIKIQYDKKTVVI